MKTNKKKIDLIIENNKTEYRNILEYLKFHFYYYGSQKKILLEKIVKDTNTSNARVSEIINLLKQNNKKLNFNRKKELKLEYGDILMIDEILRQRNASKISIVSMFISLFLIFIPACEKIIMLIFDYFNIYGIPKIIMEIFFPIVNIVLYWYILNILDSENKTNSPTYK